MASINESQQANYKVSLATLTSLFFMWGFITCMNDILIPHLKELFKLSYTQSMLVQFSFFGAYFVGSLIYFTISHYKGDPINKIGYKGGIIYGLIISAVGCALFYPAAAYSSYGLFLGALFVLGLGFTLLQIAANPYVAILGPEESASSRLNLAQGFNSLGTTLAPVLGGFLVFEFFATAGEITPEATKVPYMIFAGLFLLLVFLIYSVKLPVFKSDESTVSGLGALSFPQLKLGILGIFFYVGAEVGIGSFMINFLSYDDIAGLGESVSKNYLALYWGGSMVGRFMGAISMNSELPAAKRSLYMFGTGIAIFLIIFFIVDLSFTQISVYLLFMLVNYFAFFIGKSIPARILTLFAFINIGLLLLTIFGSGHLAMWSIISIGLFNSIMWSNVFTLSIAGLGRYTSQGASLLVMGILGGAILPLIQGGVADVLGVQKSFFIPLLGYAYIAFFGLYCYKKFRHVKAVTVAGGH